MIAVSQQQDRIRSEEPIIGPRLGSTQPGKLHAKEEILMAEVLAQMPGTIIEILVSVGDEVDEEQEVMILESMKMENPVFPPS
ncbi:MAG: acetyl-CoA carboxylase biotin carboxyl carrier protein subunit, partial [Desulfobacterales bacterium]